MFIGKQPVKQLRNSKDSVQMHAAVPTAPKDEKANKRKVQDIQDDKNAFALTAFKTKTTITKAVANKVKGIKVTGVSACPRCKILCCCLT